MVGEGRNHGEVAATIEGAATTSDNRQTLEEVDWSSMELLRQHRTRQRSTGRTGFNSSRHGRARQQRFDMLLVAPLLASSMAPSKRRSTSMQPSAVVTSPARFPAARHRPAPRATNLEPPLLCSSLSASPSRHTLNNANPIPPSFTTLQHAHSALQVGPLARRLGRRRCRRCDALHVVRAHLQEGCSHQAPGRK